MGSITRNNALNFFEKIYGDKLETHFQPLLEGKTPTEISVTVDYYVEGEMKVGNETFPLHHRWATEEEQYEGKEDDEEMKFEEYFNQYIKNKPFEKVEMTSGDRDDEIYMVCLTSNNDVQIPIGFDPESGEFSSYAELILSNEERELFEPLKEIDRIIHRWNHSNKSLDTQATYTEEIKEALFGDKQLNIKGNLSDFEKNSRIWKLFSEERIDSLILKTQIGIILEL
ncbi:hypothetical protein SFC65_19085 [Priestia filamentosa]|uniref:hypothetical protein n=1 Tax=Priestia filamentosa TaxID=1402861 RepID=UPI003982B285